jgi:hypothetical protein
MLEDKKVKFLLIRLSGVKQELEITKETYRHADTEFQKAFNEKYFPEQAQERETDGTISTAREEQPEQNKTFHEEPQPDSEDTVSASRNNDPEMKKMFRSIAKEAHPDKLVSAPEEEKREKQDLYSEAIRAFEDEDFATLYMICQKLNLELPSFDESKIKKMEDQISSVKKEISRLKSTFMWQWLFAPNKEAKEALVEQLFKRMYPGS